jgi:2-C-methyl-D-erythritol 4-phosphate cytidylyltransferase
VNSALILAGGRGVRFGAATQPKQFAEIGGKPLLIYALETYVHLPEIGIVLLVVNPAYKDSSKKALRKYGLSDRVDIASGGATRQESVRNGLVALNKLHELRDDDSIFLHNAASPNTPADTVLRCIATLETVDVAQAYVPEMRTIIETDGSHVGAVLPRSKLGCTCDPTAYRAAALQRVVRQQEHNGLVGETTIDTSLSLGMQIGLVESATSNIKVTDRWDIHTLTVAMQDNGKVAQH